MRPRCRLLARIALAAACGLAGRSAASAAVDLAARLKAVPAGGTLTLEPGTYPGPLVIDRPLRLLGSEGVIIDGQGRGSTITIAAPDVEIAGLVIRHSGGDIARDEAGIFIGAPRAFIHDVTIVDCLHGIYVKAADDCRIEHSVIRGRGGKEMVADPLVSGLRLSADELCLTETEQNQRGNGIHLWKSKRARIIGNDIRLTRDGMYFSFTNETYCADNLVIGVRYGLHYMYSNANTFERNEFRDNAAGAALMFSHDLVLRQNRFQANRSQRAYGLLMHTVDRTQVADNRIDGNTVGIFIESNNLNQFRGNRIAGNYVGFRFSDSSDLNVVAGNSFVRNVHPIETVGGNQDNHWSADRRGNHWEGALALDLNADGVADVPHREADVFGSWRRDFPAIGLLAGAPGERLIRFLYSRVPLGGISGIVDPAPLVADPHHDRNLRR